MVQEKDFMSWPSVKEFLPKGTCLIWRVLMHPLGFHVISWEPLPGAEDIIEAGVETNHGHPRYYPPKSILNVAEIKSLPKEWTSAQNFRDQAIRFEKQKTPLKVGEYVQFSKVVPLNNDKIVRDGIVDIRSNKQKLVFRSASVHGSYYRWSVTRRQIKAYDPQIKSCPDIVAGHETQVTLVFRSEMAEILKKVPCGAFISTQLVEKGWLEVIISHHRAIAPSVLFGDSDKSNAELSCLNLKFDWGSYEKLYESDKRFVCRLTFHPLMTIPVSTTDTSEVKQTFGNLQLIQKKVPVQKEKQAALAAAWF